MKWIWIILIVLVLSLFWLACAEDEPVAPKKELKTDVERLSYALGMNVGTSLKDSGAEIELTVFMRGFEDSFKGKELLLTIAQAKEIMVKFVKKMQVKQNQKMQGLVEKNKKEGAMFLEENKKQAGVVTTATGLQYMVLSQGDGPKPKVTDMVTVHYRGTLIDGTEFDSSYKTGQPATFVLNKVIRGWTEALQLMSVRSKYRLFIPSNLAYGARGSGPLIGPNATLIFEVELLEIKK